MMMKTSTPKTSNSISEEGSLYYDNARLHAIQIMLCTRMDELLEKLGVSFERTRKMYYGCCPVHGGDNRQALNLYPEGDLVPGFWQCRTKSCHRFFKKTIIGFVRGVLSRERYDWSPSSNKQKVYSFRDTVNWCCQFLNVKLENVDVDYVAVEKNKFCSDVTILTKLPDSKTTVITRAHVRDRLKIPAKYMVDRGWSPEVLTKYDVGLANNPEKPEYYNRVVVPVYDNSHHSVIGLTARSIYDKCSSCSFYHNPTEACPTDYFHNYCKWKNSPDLNRDSVLYNYWFAKTYIEETATVILVEGPGEVWRCEEAGFHMSVAMLGVNLTDEQQIILESSGAMNIIVITNNDNAGRKSDADLQEQLGRMFRLHFVKPELNDLGVTSVENVKLLIGPLLSKITGKVY